MLTSQFVIAIRFVAFLSIYQIISIPIFMEMSTLHNISSKIISVKNDILIIPLKNIHSHFCNIKKYLFNIDNLISIFLVISIIFYFVYDFCIQNNNGILPYKTIFNLFVLKLLI